MKIQRRLATMPLAILSLVAVPSIALAADKPSGETIYRQRCQSCHGTAERPSPLGPNLTGVVGRKAAATAFNYSPALKKSGLTWTRPNLDRFLSAPTRAVPGTRMVISLTNPAQRTALIDYLAGRR